MAGRLGLSSIRVTADPAEGELLVGLLRSEGIAARLDRVSSELIGAAPHLFKIQVLVPEADAGRARELIADLEYVGAAEAADRGEATEQVAAGARAPRRPLLGAGLAFLFPGGGHMYARHVRTAIVVEVGVLACLVVLTVDRSNQALAELAFATLFSLLAWDSVLAFRAVRADNRGERLGGHHQIGRGLALLGVALATGFAIQLLGDLPSWWRGRHVSTFRVGCTEYALVVENRSPTAAAVSIKKIVLSADHLLDHEAYDVDMLGSRKFQVGPHARVRQGILIPPGLIDACRGFEARYPFKNCRLIFAFTATAAAEEDSPQLDAIGTCGLGWQRDGELPAPATLVPVDPP